MVSNFCGGINEFTKKNYRSNIRWVRLLLLVAIPLNPPLIQCNFEKNRSPIEYHKGKV